MTEQEIVQSLRFNSDTASRAAVDLIETLTRERDGLRELIENATRDKRVDGKTLLDLVYVWRDQAEARAARAERERDEARQDAERWMNRAFYLCEPASFTNMADYWREIDRRCPPPVSALSSLTPGGEG